MFRVIWATAPNDMTPYEFSTPYEFLRTTHQSTHRRLTLTPGGYAAEKQIPISYL